MRREFLIATFLIATLNAQKPVVPGGTGEIGGTAMDSITRQPVRRATVRVTAPSLRGTHLTTTDDAGRFRFTELPAGRYTMSAQKAGYVETTYGSTKRRGVGTLIAIAEGERKNELTFALVRGAVISGTVTHPTGQAAAGMLIQAFERAEVGGRLFITPAGSMVTDSQGTFRFAGLAAGSYIVCSFNRSTAQTGGTGRVTSAEDLAWAAAQAKAGAGADRPPPSSREMIVAQTFYPGVTDVAAAARIDVEAGAERSGLRFALQFVPVARITGTLQLPDGSSAQGSIRLDPVGAPGGDAGPQTGPRSNATVRPDGSFEVTSQPGRYVLIASINRAVPAGREVFWAREPIVVDGTNQSGLVIRMQPTVSLTGRVVAEAGSGFDPKAHRITVSLSPFPETGSPGVGGTATSVGPNGEFSYQNITPWRYNISSSGSTTVASPGRPADWALLAVTLGGRDVMDRFVEIPPGSSIKDVVLTFTNKPAALSGRLLDASGAPAPQFFVVLIPVDREFWMARLSRSPRGIKPADDGLFRFDVVTPGDYYLAAATEFTASDVGDAALLESLIAGAVKVTVAPAKTTVQDLRIGGR